MVFKVAKTNICQQIGNNYCKMCANFLMLFEIDKNNQENLWPVLRFQFSSFATPFSYIGFFFLFIQIFWVSQFVREITKYLFFCARNKKTTYFHRLATYVCALFILLPLLLLCVVCVYIYICVCDFGLIKVSIDQQSLGIYFASIQINFIWQFYIEH